MADAYWSRYAAAERDGRSAAIAAAAKRPRTEYDMLTAGNRDVSGYLPREDPRLEDRSRRLLRETDPLGPAYDRFVRNGLPSYASSGINAGDLGGLGGVGLGRSGGGLPGSGLEERSRIGIGSVDTVYMPASIKDNQVLRDPLRRPEDHLPPDASNTLFVEGLPPSCTRREAAHIFRPFVGFKEVRLVNKEPRHPGGEPLVLCFVDFASASCAATALEALQGYKFDENERDSPSLRLQFARFPGPRAGGARDRDEYRRR
uniref:RRM domain-containing protein n=1 Tax=Araucaria cunninghamii TaxID=56994 RepID=A0A0D6R8X9_ARACU